MQTHSLLQWAAERGIRYRESLPDSPVHPTATPNALREALGGPTPEHPSDPFAVMHHLADSVEAGGLMAMGGGRFFGFVIGGVLPAALVADWLVSAWDQNTGLFAPTPATAIVEEIAGQWLLDLLGLPPHCSFAFVTGGQMANATALAAARHLVLAQAGWDVEAAGLTDDELQTLPGRYGPPGGVIVLAWEAGVCVGCVAVRPLEGAETCELKRMYVRPSHRRTGLGRRLADAALSRARELGYRTIKLDSVRGYSPPSRCTEASGLLQWTATTRILSRKRCAWPARCSPSGITVPEAQATEPGSPTRSDPADRPRAVPSANSG